MVNVKPVINCLKKNRTGDVCAYETPKTKLNKVLKDTKPDGTFVSDWVYKEGSGDLDACNGITLNGKYVYFVTDEYPYVGRCLKGAFTEIKKPKPPAPMRHHHGKHPHRH